MLRINGIKHVDIQGLVLRGATGSPMISLYGSDNVHLNHITVYGGFPGLLVNASQQINVAHCAFRGLAAPWSGRSHMKYRGTASYQIVLQNSQPYNEDIEFSYCEFTDDHDFAFFRYAKNLQFHHNYVDNFNDDGLECGAKLRWHSIAIHHNRIGACLGVLQQHEIDKDESPDAHDPEAGVMVYRNIFDQRAGVYYSLPSEPNANSDVLHAEGHLISDHGSPVFPVMRVYQNTFLRRGPVFRNYFLFGLGAVGLRKTERDVFNNLFRANRPRSRRSDSRKESLPASGRRQPSCGESTMVRQFKSPPFQNFANRLCFKLAVNTTRQVGRRTICLLIRVLSSLTATPINHRTCGLPKVVPAIDAGQPLPANWLDPLRREDQGKPDIGAIPFGVQPWGVGIEGRIPVFGAKAGETK